MNFQYSYSGGLLLSLLVLIVVVALPLKIGAHLAAAQRTGLLWCLLSAFVGMLAGSLAAAFFGGTIGAPLAATLGFILAIRFMLGTSLAGAIGLTVIAMLIVLLGLWALAHFGAIHAPTEGGIAV